MLKCKKCVNIVNTVVYKQNLDLVYVGLHISFTVLFPIGPHSSETKCRMELFTKITHHLGSWIIHIKISHIYKGHLGRRLNDGIQSSTIGV